MTEPVSAHTRRFVRCVWSLDPDLAYARHYPALSWRESSSRDAEPVGAWHAAHHRPSWGENRARALRLLAEADHLESIAQLVGATTLPAAEQVALRSGRLMREAVLQQSSLSANDAYCAPSKQQALVSLALAIHDRCLELVAAGVPVARLDEVDLSPATRARDMTPADGADAVRAIGDRLLAALGELE